MTDTNRRDVLKGIAFGGALVGGSMSVSATQSNESVQVVEAGIRYDLPHVHDHVEKSYHSRPPYTVDARGKRFVLGRATTDYKSDIEQKSSLVAEKPTERGEVDVPHSKRKTLTLPTRLTRRKRVTHGVGLTEPVRLPNVVVDWNPNAPAIDVEGVGRVDIEPNTSKSIELDPVEVNVKTETPTDEKVDPPQELTDVPDGYLAKKVEEGSETVEATPVVEVVHHGELTMESPVPPVEKQASKTTTDDGEPTTESGTETAIGGTSTATEDENDTRDGNGHDHGNGNGHDHG